jgi:dTMP kinase
MTLEWCRHPDVGLPRPDMVLFLHISPEDAAKRGGFGTERYEKKAMQDRVRGLFEEVRGEKEGEDFVIVDAGGSVEEVQGRIRREVEDGMKEVEREGRPLRIVEGW